MAAKDGGSSNSDTVSQKQVPYYSMNTRVVILIYQKYLVIQQTSDKL